VRTDCQNPYETRWEFIQRKEDAARLNIYASGPWRSFVRQHSQVCYRPMSDVLTIVANIQKQPIVYQP
jgi:hypothetical protein